MRFGFKNAGVAVLLLVSLVGVGFAQTGSVTGQVFDPAGAVVPNATVTAKSETTALTRTATTTSAGLYNFAALPPSMYTVTVEAPGFETMSRNHVVLNVAATLPVNFNLQLAGAVASVDVQDVTVAPVETDSFQLSTVINSKQINDLPLILRDPYQLTLLAPGVVTSTNNDGGFSVNGQRDRNNNFMLDGADNNDTSVPGIPGGISSANPDSTQEFRVITNNFDAEFGRNTGAIIDVVTRAGGNQFHGDAYEFGRYNALGARDFFNKKGDPQDPYVRNNFGASVGGPIWKDHTFFFLNGDVQRFRTTRTSSQTTPTAAFKTGKFNFIDQADGTVTPVDLTDPTNPNNFTGLGLDPQIQKILAITPVGTDNGDGVSTTYNFASPDALNAYNLTGRFDQKLSDRHQLTARYIYGHSADNDPFHDEVLPGYGNTASISTSHNGVISIASSLSANATNLVRGSFNLNNSGFFCNHAGIDAINGTDSFGNGRDVTLPYFSFTFGCSPLGDSNAQARLSSTLLFADTFSLTKGAHSMKFGGEYRSVKDNNYDNFFSRDAVTFDNFSNFQAQSYQFNGPDPSVSPVGSQFEDLIWGAQGAISNNSESQFFTREGVRRGNDLSRFRQHEWALFAQDTWKVNSKFTAILGVRYAFNGVPYEKDGNFSNFYGDASVATPANGFVFTSVGPGTGRQLYADSWKLIEPRVGFSYDLNGDGKTAIRGGFGIFHDRIFDNLFGNAKSNPPYQTSLNEYPFDGTPTTPTLANFPFPGQLAPSDSITDGDFNTPVVIDPNLKMPTSQSYNIGIQHQISRQLTLEVNYVGSHTTHALREIDGAPPQPELVQQALAAGILPSALQGTALYTGGTDANGNSFNPTVNNNAFYHELFQTSVVNGSYNALQARVTGQLGGLTLTGSYTWSHALDNGSDPIVPGAGGPSTFAAQSITFTPASSTVPS
jgi:hypothetical protein